MGRTSRVGTLTKLNSPLLQMEQPVYRIFLCLSPSGKRIA